MVVQFVLYLYYWFTKATKIMKNKKIYMLLVGIFMGALFSQAENPNTYLLDIQKLEKIKQEKESVYQDAVIAIVKDARKELKRKPASVLQKEMMPPSGDKHDYMSMGPYWWPDPQKKDGLPYIRRDGERNPELDKLDRNRMGNTIKAITNLCYGYYFSEEDQFAAKAVELLRVWFLEKDTRMNPNLDYGQMIPGHNNGLGRAEGVIDIYCFVEMLDALELIKSSSQYTKKDQIALKEWFSELVDWLQDSRVGKDERAAKNNHGVAYDVQLARYALFAGKEEVTRQVVNEFAEKRIFKQIEPDGKQPYELVRTIAFSYTIFNISHMLDMCQIAKKIGVDLFQAESQDGRSIEKAIDFFIPYMGKTREEWPYKQIKEWDVKQEEATWILRRASFFAPAKNYEKIGASVRKNKTNNRNLIFYAQ